MAGNLRFALALVRWLVAAILIIGLTKVPVIVAAQDQDPGSTGIFSDAQATADRISAADADPTVLRYRFVTIDLVQFNPVLDPATSDTPITFNLFDDASYVAVFSLIEGMINNGITLTGSLADVPDGSVTIAIVEGVLSGCVRTPDGIFNIRFSEDGVYVIEQVQNSMRPMGMDPLDLPVPQGDTVQAQVGDDTGEQLDVMVVYTPAARSAMGGTAAIQAGIAAAITDANLAYANSQVNQRMVLVYTQEMSGYSEAGRSWTSTLYNLTYLIGSNGETTDALDIVQTLRNTYAADLVVMVIDDANMTAKYCGLGWMLSSSFAPVTGYTFESYAYSLVDFRCLASQTLAHETGHNLGANHDRLIDNNPGIYDYSHGYKIFNGSNCLYYTIMAYYYWQSGGTYYYCNTDISYFSNPNVTYNGYATGVASGVDSANVALTLNNTAATAAQWRDGPVPSPPTGLTITRSSLPQLVLNWTAPSGSYVIQYLIERLVGSTWTQIAVVPASSTTYTNTGLTCGTSYSYRVRARNGDGYSTYTSQASDTACLVVPPTNLTATASTSAVSITLNWTDTNTTETGYQIERSVHNAATWSAIASVGANTTTFTNSASILCATAYDYRVRAYQGSDYSGYSSVATATTLICPPLTPTGFTATAVSQSRINLSWNDPSNDPRYQESGYDIQRAIGAGSFSMLVTIPSGTLTYSNSGLTCGTNYSYRIQTFNAGGTSSWATVTTSTNACAAPAAPTALAARPISRFNAVITWGDVEDETAYYVERSLNGSTWTQIATLPSNSTQYIDSMLAAGISYYYRVRSANAYSTVPYTYAGPLMVTTFTISYYSPIVHLGN